MVSESDTGKEKMEGSKLEELFIAVILLAVLILPGLVRRMKKTKTQARPKPFKPFNSPEFVLRDKGEDILRHAPKPDPIQGYANFPTYSVRGRKRTTNRINTRCIMAASEDEARRQAIEIEGLMEPLSVEIYHPPMSSGDNEYGLKIPAGATQEDAQRFENSVLAHDTKHIPAPFMEYLTQWDIPMSWLSGRNHAAEEVFRHCDLKEKAILYGYAVHCSLQGILPGNIDKEPLQSLYIAFADAATRDIKICESIAKRPGSDMWEPSTRTIAYEFALNFFQQRK